jgi:hypothetical protein
MDFLNLGYDVHHSSFVCSMMQEIISEASLDADSCLLSSCVLCVLCGQKLLTAKAAEKTAEAAEKFLQHRDKPVPTMVPRVFHRLHGVTCGLQSNHMQDHTETLSVGARAPEFLLSAANREGILSLSGFLNRGTLILEFLRGTW